MKSTALASSVLLFLAADQDLTTRYAAETALRVESLLEVELESTTSMVRDGEPVEGRGGFGAGSSSTTHRSVAVDRYLEAPDGVPGRVRRRWTELEGGTEVSMGGEDRSLPLESDFADLEVEIARDADGETSVETVAGSGPDVDVLARLRPELALDAFLPTGPVAATSEWSLDSAAVLRGLGLDLTLFRRPEREGEGGGGPGGGRRGGFGGRGGGVDSQLASAEWSGRATFVGVEDFDGVECARIALALEAESETDEEGTTATFQAKLEGSLWIDLGAHRPAGLDLEGTLSSEMDMTREREGSVTEIQRESAGTCKLRVRVAAQPYQDE